MLYNLFLFTLENELHQLQLIIFFLTIIGYNITRMDDMKNKGFTLIELIITIALMALVGIVISTNMVGLFSNEEDTEYENFIKEIEDAACVYIETTGTKTTCRQNNGCKVTTNELISKGYIDEDLKDPTTNELVKGNDNYSVNITWVNNEKTCTIVSK